MGLFFKPYQRQSKRQGLCGIQTRQSKLFVVGVSFPLVKSNPIYVLSALCNITKMCSGLAGADRTFQNVRFAQIMSAKRPFCTDFTQSRWNVAGRPGTRSKKLPKMEVFPGAQYALQASCMTNIGKS